MEMEIVCQAKTLLSGTENTLVLKVFNHLLTFSEDIQQHADAGRCTGSAALEPAGQIPALYQERPPSSKQMNKSFGGIVQREFNSG